ncbi:MAG: cytosine deaminase [Cyanothece sp. SIO1E1]|nr:cytosine deaminase [Cyanothece sp. SIO1E1]
MGILIASGLSLLLLLSLLAWVIYWFKNLYSFLAVNSPIQADALVVEGWIPDNVLKQVIAEFNQGAYRRIIVTGGPMHKRFCLKYTNFAELTAATLVEFGLNPEHIVAVPYPLVLKHRTYNSAVQLAQWLATSDLYVQAINLYTLGAHARRSRFLFRKALTPGIKVGILAADNPYYDTQYWWRSSEGFRSVVSEAIAYFYIRFFKWQA